MNEKLLNDIYDFEESFNYEKNGKKNIIIGKSKKFSNYFAIFLKKLEKEDSFTKFIDILKNNPNIEEIYIIVYILDNSFSYIHSNYFKENNNIIKTSIINCINNLDFNELKKSSNKMILISNFLSKVNINNTNLFNTEEIQNINNDFILVFSTKKIEKLFLYLRDQG